MATFTSSPPSPPPSPDEQHPATSSPLSSIDIFELKYARSKVEDYAKTEVPSDQTSKILTAFLDHAPPDSLKIVAEEIAESKQLRELADHYFSAILVPIRAHGGKTPSAVPSARSGDIDYISSEITSERRDQVKLKAQCLARDGNRCLLTGLYDSEKAAEVLTTQERQNENTVPTEAAHIVPFSLASFTERERAAKAAIWEAIYHVFPRIRNFTTEDINDPRNAMTLMDTIHGVFGRFQLGLEPTGTPNRYVIKKYGNFPTLFNLLLPKDGYVTFTAHDGRYPLPDENLLALHASVAAILHASGMSEVIERILEERDLTPCLASDGSTPIGKLLMVF